MRPDSVEKPHVGTFTLQALLATFAVIASAMGAFGPWGLLVGVFLVGAVVCFRTSWNTPLGCVVVIAFLLIAYLLLLPAVESAREAARRAVCTNNLRDVGLGLHCYHDQYKTFPPAYVPGPDGRPWHSWRVLILPFIEEGPLYAKYRFDEPWDGPNNSKLAASRPYTYSCPQSGDWGPGNTATSYFAVVGPKAAWPGATPRALREFADGGTGNTLLLLEVAGRQTCWMEPSEVDFDQLVAMTTPDPKVIGVIAHPNETDHFHVADGGTVNVVLADGTVHRIPWGVPGKTLMPLLTVDADGDAQAVLDGFDFAVHPRPHWPRILALVALSLSTIWFFWTTRPRKMATPSDDPLP